MIILKSWHDYFLYIIEKTNFGGINYEQFTNKKQE